MEENKQSLQATVHSAASHDSAGGLSAADLQDLSILLEEPQIYIEELLKIQTKSGEIAPFVFNQAQQRIYREYMQQYRAGKPVRLIVLKARQLGFSTWTSAMFFHAACTNENIVA